MSRTGKNLVTGIVIVMLAVGAPYLYMRYDEHMTAVSRASLDWPSVDGLVTASGIETRRRSSANAGKKIRHHVRVDYEYVVDGELYSNDVVRFDQDDLSTTDMQRLVGNHPVGRRVQVYYDPDEPDQSVLVPGSY